MYGVFHNSERVKQPALMSWLCVHKETTFDVNTLNLNKHYVIQESGTLDVHKICFDLALISVFSYKMSGLC
jgi:hypothetical protein